MIAIRNLLKIVQTKITLNQLIWIGIINFIFNIANLLKWKNTSSISIALITFALILRTKYKREYINNYSILYFTYSSILLFFMHMYNSNKLFIRVGMSTMIIGFVIGVINYYIYIKK